MRVNDVLAIQMLHSRLRLMEMARQYPQIPSRLFAQTDNTTVRLAPDPAAVGFQAVNTYYHSLLARTEQAGGFLRGDLPTTPVIQVAQDGQTAHATFLTFGPHVSEDTPQQLCYRLGFYESRCRVTNGVWRIEQLRWRPVLGTKPVPFRPEENNALSAKQSHLWPQPPQRLHELRTTGEESQNAKDTLSIEKAFGAFLQRCAAGRESQAVSFFTPDATLQIGDASAQPAAQTVQKLAPAQKPWLCLGTSRIIDVNGDRASASWAAFAIQADDQTGRPRWGRWYVELVRRDERWQCAALRWVTVAALEPWQIGSFDRTACLPEGGNLDAG